MNGQSHNEHVQDTESEHSSESYLSLFRNVLQPPHHAHWQENYGQVYNNVDDAISEKASLKRCTRALEKRIPVLSKWSTSQKGLEDKASTKSDDERHNCICCEAEDIHRPKYSKIEMQDRKFDQCARYGPKAAYCYNDLGYVSPQSR